MEHRDPWDDYRVRRNLAVAAWGGFAPLGFGLVWASDSLGFDITLPAVAFFVVWVQFLGMAEVRRSTFPCPRCGWMFFTTATPKVSRDPFARECRHCGLPKWADPGEWDESDEIEPAEKETPN